MMPCVGTRLEVRFTGRLQYIERFVKQASAGFFEKHGMSWDHEYWLEFLKGVRTKVSVNEFSDAEAGQMLEAARAERLRTRA